MTSKPIALANECRMQTEFKRRVHKPVIWDVTINTHNSNIDKIKIILTIFVKIFQNKEQFALERRI